ncbi:amino acid ABC transporter substrate-binding protein [Bowmanella denitrificans]|uniref:amino acid ABC transporter substrate-binding protein n=1 Tax=Bowmanella denitrificans TaxID=366582 RepID=UPI003183AA45
MMLKTKLILMLGGLLLGISVQAATWNIVYPRPMSEKDDRTRYPVELLTLALEHTGVNFKLSASDRIMLQGKAINQLKSSREINVLWSMTDNQREEDLLPIRIPIYKGLIGLRLPLMKPGGNSDFSPVKDLESLLHFKPISGRDWPDTKILQANGFDVVTAEDYEELFVALEHKRGDFLPRSVVEIWHEIGLYQSQHSFDVDANLALYYPTATYFFVNRKNVVLARLIESGLEKIIANGKFDELFLFEHQAMLDNANLSQRQILRLNNPILPPLTPLDRNELWYQVK